MQQPINNDPLMPTHLLLSTIHCQCVVSPHYVMQKFIFIYIYTKLTNNIQKKNIRQNSKLDFQKKRMHICLSW